jgi:hypothetical protein
MGRRRTAYLALAALAAAATVFAGGYSAGRAAADTGHPASPYPDWFLPIWDAYDRNPAVTPAFDFASLYSADVG